MSLTIFPNESAEHIDGRRRTLLHVPVPCGAKEKNKYINLKLLPSAHTFLLSYSQEKMIHELLFIR